MTSTIQNLSPGSALFVSTLPKAERKSARPESFFEKSWLELHPERSNLFFFLHFPLPSGRQNDPIKNWLPLSDEIRTYFQDFYSKLEDRNPESI